MKTEISVLDRGFVRLVDSMGNDSSIVQAARVSYHLGIKTPKKDRQLIHYLMRNDHTSPFEQVVFKFHIKLPIFVARQLIRHRTARVNEISGRYTQLKNEFYIPQRMHICRQSKDNKQGRETSPVNSVCAKTVIDTIHHANNEAYSAYEKMIDMNIAKELARIVLPVNIYTELYWQIDLHNLFHFLKLRLDCHAQYEIRVYAEAIRDLIIDICPIAYKAFIRHKLMGDSSDDSLQES